MSGARVWRATTQKGSWAIRQWPPAGPPAEKIDWIHRVLGHAADRGLDFLPVPLKSDDGHTYISHDGAFWEVAKWLPGKADANPLGATKRLLAAAGSLSRFHRAVIDFPQQQGVATQRRSLVLADRADRLVVARSIDWQATAEAALRRAPAAAEVLRAVANKLAIVLTAADERVHAVQTTVVAIQPIIRDARREHFLFTGDRVTGLVDFGAMTIDTPAVDLARLLGEWAGDDRAAWLAAIDAYGLGPIETGLLAALDFSGTALAAGNWLRWIANGRPAPADRLCYLENRLATFANQGHPLEGR